MSIYPNCPTVTRVVEVGGYTKWELMEKMKQQSILLNEYGKQLLLDDKFTTSETKFSLKTVELTVKDLGFVDGASLSKIFQRAKELRLELCPIEVGPYIRIQFLNQEEGNVRSSSKTNQAPTGSITIASEVLSDDDDFPKGFYLRKIDGQLWLRGYIADDLHIWSPDDHFIFSISEKSL